MGTDSKQRRYKNRKRKVNPKLQRFSNYFVFGLGGTMCCASFLFCYIMVLVCLWPLLIAQPDIIPDETPREYLQHMHIPVSLQEARVPGKEKLHKMADAVKKRIDHLKQGRGVSDGQLLEQAKKEFEQKSKERDARDKRIDRYLKNEEDEPNAVGIVGHAPEGQRNGVIILGMHRSGTSMLSGLLVTGCGYQVGKSSDLIGASFDNEKGFFERVDVVLQNDEFFFNQDMAWEHNVINFDFEQAVSDKKEGIIPFKHGRTGLKWLNNPSHVPYLQKDPRMCITLKTWLKLLNHEPAVVFTYRHPVEVAKSLHKREKGFTMERGLRLWIVYNMRALQNARELCVVKSSNTAVLANPLKETQRVADELTSKCGVVAPPKMVKQEDVDKFVDPSLQHNKKGSVGTTQRLLHEYNDGKCKVYAFHSELEESDPGRVREAKLYEWAMKIYCDLESGEAYEFDYEWPLG
ncbi:MAG: hypothetical protein SGBAC_001638 [Bacillariaceae sp.]